ncbi:MAG TPA: hypothetical protein PKE66_10495 [Pyrinomonadaceae bacterium]|nr:hypothetical protein [Pyrinomonadaceae bacterium]
MKKFITTIAFASLFFTGLGAIVEKAGASFKSDQKALEIVAKARQAIGGEAAIAQVQSMVIVGRSTHTIKIGETERTEQGETEIAMQFPDKLQKSVKIGDPSAAAGDAHVIKERDVVVIRKGEGAEFKVENRDGEFTTSDGKKIIVRRAEPGTGEVTGPDGKTFVFKKGEEGNAEFTTEDGKKVIVRAVPSGDFEWKAREGAENHVMHRAGGVRQNELLRIGLMLLVSAPQGMDVSYTFEGEGNVDGTQVNIVAASFAGSVYRMHIDKFTNLPVAIGYTGGPMPHIVRFNKGEAVETEKDIVVFTGKMEGAVAATAETLVKLSDFRSTGGVQLPYRWTTTTGGRTTEVFDVTSFEVNPSNIAERFKDQKMILRMAKPAEKN